jgi:hypothetical protein
MTLDEEWLIFSIIYDIGYYYSIEKLMTLGEK